MTTYLHNPASTPSAPVRTALHPPTPRTATPTFNPILVIPLFNHAPTIHNVIDSLQKILSAANEKIPLLLINDGSTDNPPLSAFLVPHSAFPTTLLSHDKNRGKGSALHTGFAHAAAQGYTHAITLDADGQHDPADVLKIIAAARAHPHVFILGERNMDDPSVPKASKTGRNIARFWMRIHTGQDLPDTQCGLRAYPLAPTLAVPQRFRRYDYESEILARLAWGGVPIRTVPVRCIYFPAAQRITHFRPVIDSLRGVRVNAFLLTRRLLPLPFRRLATPAETAHAPFGSWWKYASWRNALASALNTGTSNAGLALAFSLGIFVGLTPFYLLQTLLTIYFARRLHLNVLAAIIGSQISIPPLAPLWVTLSYSTGHLLFHGQWNWSAITHVDFSLHHLAPFLLGNLLVAFTTALLGLLLARALLYCLRTETRL